MKRNSKSFGILLACLGLFLIPGMGPGPSRLASANAHAEVELKIYTGTPGTSSYIAATALADLLKKKHPWLRAVVIETAQSADAVKTVALNPELRKTGIFSSNSTIHHNVVAGKGSFNSPIEYQVLALIRSDAISMVTLNPRINTMDDLSGKKISVGTKAGPGPVFEALLDAYGIKVDTPEYLSWEPAANALLNGKIDAAAETLGDTTLAPYLPPAVLKPLMAQREFHVISMDKETVQQVSKKTPIGYMEIPPKVFGAPVVAISNKTFWGVCPEFDSEAAYALVKFLAENATAFKDYDPSLACITKATLAHVPIPPLVLHPAAEKYYKENGIKIRQ